MRYKHVLYLGVLAVWVLTIWCSYGVWSAPKKSLTLKLPPVPTSLKEDKKVNKCPCIIIHEDHRQHVSIFYLRGCIGTKRTCAIKRYMAAYFKVEDKDKALGEIMLSFKTFQRLINTPMRAKEPVENNIETDDRGQWWFSVVIEIQELTSQIRDL